LHYFLPFVIAFLVLIHLVLLHQFRSNNPLGLNTTDSIFFAPYFTLKDIVGAIIFFQIFFLFVFFAPNLAGHSDNYIPANPLVTPTHIVPEWYFLPFYAILRSVPNKLGGVVLMLLSILVLFFFPFLNKQVVNSTRFKPFHKIIY
jgi:quinol-cytochrome oxidoreductase complex cytochrome b subunit